MLPYVLLGGVKKFSELALVHPHAAVTREKHNISLTVGGIVDDDGWVFHIQLAKIRPLKFRPKRKIRLSIRPAAAGEIRESLRCAAGGDTGFRKWRDGQPGSGVVHV